MVAAGYYPAVSEDGNTIIVREKDYSDLSVDLYAIDLKSMTMSVIAEDYDHVNGVKFSNGTLTRHSTESLLPSRCQRPAMQ